MIDRNEVYESARTFNGVTHGIDRFGVCSLSFPSILYASLFAAQWSPVTEVNLRDTVSSFSDPVVVQVKIFSPSDVRTPTA